LVAFSLFIVSSGAFFHDRFSNNSLARYIIGAVACLSFSLTVVSLFSWLPGSTSTFEESPTALESVTTTIEEAVLEKRVLLERKLPDFDPVNFDPILLQDHIDYSALSDATKETLRAAVEAGRANPRLQQAVVEQVKAALGL
jgi:hypothetical protein